MFGDGSGSVRLIKIQNHNIITYFSVFKEKLLSGFPSDVLRLLRLSFG